LGVTTVQGEKEEARSEIRVVDYNIERRKNREVRLQRAIGWRRGDFRENGREIRDDRAEEHSRTLNAKAGGGGFRAGES